MNILKPSMEAIRNASVLVVGDAMLDRYWFGDASRISPEAPVPVVKVTRTEDRLGGAANVARNSASLEARTSLLAIIGDDEAGTKIMDLLEASKVRPCLYRAENFTTTLKLRILARNQQMLRTDFESSIAGTVLDQHSHRFTSLLPDHDVASLPVGEEAMEGSLDDIPRRFERSVLTQLYRSYPSTRKLAKRLGVSHTAIANKLREYGLSQKKGDE